VRGAFASFTHRHEFHSVAGGTLMVDVFRYTSPLGPLGVLADKLLLERSMTRFLRERATFLKTAAERPSLPAAK
jgi:ligand-binding SRPBCC domain-containing protein